MGHTKAPIETSEFLTKKLENFTGTQGEVDAQKSVSGRSPAFFVGWHVKLSRGVGWDVCCVQCVAPLTRQTA